MAESIGLALETLPCVNDSPHSLFSGKLVIPAAPLPCALEKWQQGNKLICTLKHIIMHWTDLLKEEVLVPGEGIAESNRIESIMSCLQFG